MLFFPAITIEICPRDKLTEYWATTKQFHTRFYGTAMQRDSYRHILRFLHFTDNNNEPDMTDENSDGLWKTRNLFEILNKTFSKFYSPSEHLAVDEVFFFFFLKEGSFSDNTRTYPKHTNVLAPKFTNHVTRLDTRI